MAIFLFGDQGVGKNIVFEWFRSQVLGGDVTLQTADPENDVFGRFCNLLNKVFILVDEDVRLGSSMNKFKNLITADTIGYEKKGIPKISTKNCSNFVFTTNDERGQVDPDDRRCAWFKCSPVYKGNTTYFKNLWAFLTLPYIPSIFYQYLMDFRDTRKYSGSFQASRPITDFYIEMQVYDLVCCVVDVSVVMGCIA